MVMLFQICALIISGCNSKKNKLGYRWQTARRV